MVGSSEFVEHTEQCEYCIEAEEKQQKGLMTKEELEQYQYNCFEASQGE